MVTESRDDDDDVVVAILRVYHQELAHRQIKVCARLSCHVSYPYKAEEVLLFVVNLFPCRLEWAMKKKRRQNHGQPTPHHQ